MGGNVWEWCEDKYRSGISDRVLRGACWRNGFPGTLLSSGRINFTPDIRYYIIGFRCVLVSGSGG